MDVKKCDRCGEVFPRDEGGLILTPDMVSGFEETPYEYFGDKIYTADLCRRCMVHFKTWFSRYYPTENKQQ